MRVLIVVALALFLSGCQSADERKLQDMVEQRVAQTNFQIARLSEPFIYRAGDARMACLTVTLKNQWGELQPEQRLIAWYIPRTDSWHTDNFRPADDGLTCEQYVDPERIAAERATQAAAQQARMDEIARRQAEQNAEWRRDADKKEQAQNEQYERQQRESAARQADEESAREAEYQRLQRESDAALQRSLENGPTNQ
jgi:hypothetical protein